MRFFMGAVAAVLLAAPSVTLAADGVPAAGKARAESGGCFTCHGAKGIATADGIAANKFVPNLAAEPDLFVQFQLVFFRNGTRKNDIMNPMAESLSDQDVRNLGAFFASLPPPPSVEPPDPAPDQTHLGEKVAQAIRCANCHGDSLEGVDNIPRLAGQREDYLYKALRDFKAGARITPGPAGMGDVVYPLGDTEMQALAHYLSRLH